MKIFGFVETYKLLQGIHYVTGVKVEPKDYENLQCMSLALFLLLTANGVLSPLRDTMGAIKGNIDVSYLISLSTVIMIVINPVTSYIAIRRTAKEMGKLYLRGASVVCASILVCFLFCSSIDYLTVPFFFVWTNVHSVLSVSAVWAISGDVLNLRQSRSYLALLSLAASAGHIFGAALVSFVTTLDVDIKYALVLPVLLLELCFRAYSAALSFSFKNSKPNRKNSNKKKTYTACVAFSSMYTVCLVFFTLCYSLCLTILYLEKINALSGLKPNDKASIFASMNFLGSVATILLQIFFTGRLLSNAPTAFSLMLLPLAFIFGFILIFLWKHNPVGAIYFLEILRRVVAYGIVKPVRELLYQILDRGEKYGTKALNDSIARKAGDIIAPLYVQLSARWRMLNTASICAFWSMLAIYLGLTFDARTSFLEPKMSVGVDKKTR